MKLLLGISLGVCWLLVSCAGGSPTSLDASSTKPPIKSQPGGSSILVPATLSPAEKTALPQRSIVHLTLTNRSDWNVCYVYISPPTEDTWGDDRLNSEEVIEVNRERVFDLQPGFYDVRAENCDYIGLEEKYEIDLSGAFTWEVNNPPVLDIFSFQDKGAWKVHGSTSQGAISDEAYILIASQPAVIASATAGRKFDNLVLTVEATPLQSDGSSPAGYGMMCRVQPNGDGYLFMIREDSHYAIFRNDQNERVPMVDWKESSEVLSGAQLNVIEAHCDGENLALRINGVTVEDITDSNYGSGDIGLAVLPGETGHAQVQFDNLVVTKP